MSTYETQDQKWSAIVSRDRNAASAFVFSVTTTGIYCRPNCGARQPRKVNVKFFTDSVAATQAGYRACKRCKPELEYWDPVNDMIAKACGIISSYASQGTEISLAELAGQCDVTKFYLHRTFKKVTGQTPKDFARMCLGVQPQASGAEVGSIRSPQLTELTDELGLRSECLTVGDSEPYNAALFDFEMQQYADPSSDWYDITLEELPSQVSAVTDQTYTISSAEKNYPSRCLISPSERPHAARGPSSPNTPVWYTLKLTQLGTVLIAYHMGTICALKIGVSAKELVTDLQEYFHPNHIYEIDFADDRIDVSIKQITADILEALERPSGRTIILPFGENMFV